MDAKRRDLALLIYGSLNFDARGRIKLTPSVSVMTETNSNIVIVHFVLKRDFTSALEFIHLR